MKRILFSVLILLGIWWLLQLPSVNAAVFAFLALGINPLTNHPFSTLTLISVLLALSGTGVALLFSKTLGDFFGGLSDWMTHAERSYDRSSEAAVEQPILAIATLPAHTEIENPSELVSVPAKVLFVDFIASVTAIQLPTMKLPGLRPYIIKLSAHYQSLIIGIKARLLTTRIEQESPLMMEREEQPYNVNLAPELAEVVAIFEQLALETEAAEPIEAVVIASKVTGVLRLALHRRYNLIRSQFSYVRRRTLRGVTYVSVYVRTTEQKITAMGSKTAAYIRRALRAAYRDIYHGVLLVALGALITATAVIRISSVGFYGLARMVVAIYQQVCRGVVFCAIAVTLGMFVAGRGVVAAVHGIGYGLTALSRGICALISTLVMLVFLGAGYLLYAFSLCCFVIWELCEPFARKLDKWLGNTLESKDSFAEVTRVGHEMSRTFTQLYREIRQIMHGTYH